jgi:hypothetical protein
MSVCYKVSFDFEDDSRNANSQDFRDLLMEKFQQAVLEGRMTNIVVALDHEEMEENHSLEKMQEELRAAGWTNKGSVWKSPSGACFRGPFGAWKVMMDNS